MPLGEDCAQHETLVLGLGLSGNGVTVSTNRLWKPCRGLNDSGKTSTKKRCAINGAIRVCTDAASCRPDKVNSEVVPSKDGAAEPRTEGDDETQDDDGKELRGLREHHRFLAYTHNRLL